MLLTQSKDGIPIRLTHERFNHVVKSHTDMAGQEDGFVVTVTKLEDRATFEGGIWYVKITQTFAERRRFLFYSEIHAEK